MGAQVREKNLFKKTWNETRVRAAAHMKNSSTNIQ
jgi:hypothetical protein